MVNAFDPSKPCSFPADRWYLQRADAKTAFPANHVPCLDAASGRMNETCVSACTCRSARREKAPADNGGAMLDYVECLRVNASVSCKGAGMVECLSETVRLAGATDPPMTTRPLAATPAPNATATAAKPFKLSKPLLLTISGGVVVVLVCILFICCTRRKAKARQQRDQLAQAQLHSGRSGDGVWTDASRLPVAPAEKLKSKMMTKYPPMSSASMSSSATTVASHVSTSHPDRRAQASTHSNNTSKQKKASRRPEQWSDRASELSPESSQSSLMKLTESVIDLHDTEADDYFVQRSRPPRNGGYSSSIASDTSSMLSIGSFSALDLSRPDGASDSISSWDSRVPSECALSFTIDEEEEEQELKQKQKKTRSFRSKAKPSKTPRTRQEIEF